MGELLDALGESVGPISEFSDSDEELLAFSAKVRAEDRHATFGPDGPFVLPHDTL